MPPDSPGLDALTPHLDPLALRRWMAQEVWRRQPATRLRPMHAPTITTDTAAGGDARAAAVADDRTAIGWSWASAIAP